MDPDSEAPPSGSAVEGEDMAKPWTDVARKARRAALHYSSSWPRGILHSLETIADYAYGAFIAPFSSIAWTHRKSRRRRRALPLPLPSTIKELDEVQKIIELFEQVSDKLICRLHDCEKNLQFWKERAEGTDTHKVKFMLLEQGPYAFLQGLAKLLSDSLRESSSTHGLVVSALAQISWRVKLLSALQRQLASAVGEVFKEADKFGEDVQKGQIKEAVHSALLSVNAVLMRFEGSYDVVKVDYNTAEDGNVNIPTTKITLEFDPLPSICTGKKDLEDTEISRCVDMLLGIMEQLDDGLSILMQNYRKPRRATRLWLRYTGGAVGLAVASGWLVQHSQLMGSSDLENWLKHGGEAVVAFTKDHVEEPLLSIRDDLFETFRRRHHGAAELEDVQLTADSLRRMLKAFAEQSKGQDVSKNATEQELMEIVMNRYEKEITHPLQNLLGGELFRAMLIQVQKLKLDIETAMLELNQILRANEINFAVLAALPALLFAILLGWLLKVSLLRSKGAEGRGRAARLHRRMLLAEVERTVIMCQIISDQGQNGDESLQHYGMIVYYLDRFYRAVERHAIRSGEWPSLRGDILILSKPSVGLPHKQAITARMERIYECILPLRSK